MAAPLRRRIAQPLRLSACSLALLLASAGAQAAEEPPHPASLDEAIIRSAARHGIPESLVRRVVMRESKYNPRARNHSFWGLMQISYPTARSMGFKGSPQELLNPVVNLRYAVPYLANAFVIAGKRQDAAVRLYASGYYDTAKRRGLLGFLRTADSAPLSGVPDEPVQVASVAAPQPQQDGGIFGGLFGPQQMPRDSQAQPAVVASADAAPQPQGAPADAAASAASTAPAPNGKVSEAVSLVADKHGTLHPPKGWQRDGGTTVIARGEQSLEQVASYEKAAGVDEPRGRHRHSHKTSVFASLDAPPAGAQAYAATTAAPSQSDSQAAIAQATAGQSPAASQPEAPQVAVATAAPAPAVPDATAASDHSKSPRARRAARRNRHHEAETTAVAAAPAQPTAPDQPAAAQAAEAPQPAPDSQQAAQAAAPAQTASASQPDPAEEMRGTASPQQAAEPDEKSSGRRRHRSRHLAHGSKRTAVAAQSPEDGHPQAAPEPAPAAQP